MYLILVRHAEKDPGGGPDPGLSLRGLTQAVSLADALAGADEWPNPDRICASPKRRARQTVEPLAAKTNRRIEIVDDLDERRSNETNAGFRQRLRRAVSDLESGLAKCVVFCSHLDWIEEFRSLADCETDLVDSPYDLWAPAQYLVLRLDDLWTVVKFGRIA